MEFRLLRITDVRVKLMEQSEDRLRAFCTITLEDVFVVRDLKVIDGGDGAFVAMPSRKLTASCPKCRAKNPVRVNYCASCGARLPVGDVGKNDKIYADIAHPINTECRDMIQTQVVKAYEEELVRASRPGYVNDYDENSGAPVTP